VAAIAVTTVVRLAQTCGMAPQLEPCSIPDLLQDPSSPRSSASSPLYRLFLVHRSFPVFLPCSASLILLRYLSTATAPQVLLWEKTRNAMPCNGPTKPSNLIEISAQLNLTTVARLTYSRHDHISMSAENYIQKQHCLRVLRLILGLIDRNRKFSDRVEDHHSPQIHWVRKCWAPSYWCITVWTF